MSERPTARGLRIPRRFTSEGTDPYATIEWARRDSRITNPDGSVVFEVKDAEIPASWSQVATDIIVSKYFRKAGVPQVDEAGDPIVDEDGKQIIGSESSARQVFDRLAGTWRWWGEKHGYFATEGDAQAFEDEMKYMLANQIASPNSPQWFNTGLAHAYGITGTPQGFWFVDPETGVMTESSDAYTHPAPHACFPAGIRITTRDGFRPIEKIESGDEVLTHTGRFRRVSATTQRQVDEDLVTIAISKLRAQQFTATANHPVLAVRRELARNRSVRPTWIPAGDLRVGDYVVVGRQDQSVEHVPPPADLASFAGPNFEVSAETLTTRNSPHRPTMTRFVDLSDPSLFRLFGRWLGDGSIGHETRDGELSSVNFVFRGDDADAQEDVTALMARHFGVTARIEFAKGQNTAHLRFVRRPLARFFADTFGFGFAGKKIPGFIYELPRSHRLEFLVGLFKADGCILNSGNARMLCFDHSNRDLTEGIWRLLRSLGFAPSITGGEVRAGGTMPHFRVTVSVKDAVELAERTGVAIPDGPKNLKALRVGNEHAYRISDVQRTPFYGTVYNFAVEEDESYVAGGVVVHNCFIQAVNDDLVNPGGIMDLWVREARLFKMGSGCTAGDSRIYVLGEGFIPIRDLYSRYASQGRPVRDFDGKGRYIDIGGDEVLTLSLDERSGEFTVDKVEMVWSYDVDQDDKLTVRFDTGAKVAVSAWHPFLVWDGERIVERRADQLARGDAVIGPNETAMESLTSEPIIIEYKTSYFGKAEDNWQAIDVDLAWLIGYFLGDGAFGRSRSTTTNHFGKRYEYQRYRLRFFDETIENLERVQEIVSRHFGETARIGPIAKSNAGSMITYTGRRVTGFFASLFEPGSKTYTAKMPRFIWLAGPEIGKAFLAGILDSDGNVLNGRANFFTASPELARDVATLSSLHGMGGRITQSGNGSEVTVVRKAARQSDRLAVAGYMSHPGRKQRLLDHTEGRQGERAFCMPLSTELARELFGDRDSTEWLGVTLGDERFHLGRLRYENLINPRKLDRAVGVLDRQDELAQRIGRIARSIAFVTSVDPCDDDPDFYDLTVANNSNYLAGENGLVVIHNTGSNFSQIRAENEILSGGGKSSGVMSFLKIGDRAAGAIKSGGTTRRAAKMVILDIDHPDIEDFIDWKKHEEDKARVLIKYGGYPADFNGEAYATVSGQNSNNSVRVPNEFVEAVRNDGDWRLTERTTGKVRKTVKARDLWRRIAEAAWACADPGVQYDTIINEWHTAPAGGKIRATNPCAEYVFLDDTACNLASINLIKFYDDASGGFDTEGYEHAIRLWTIALEISVTMAHFPSRPIAQGSYDYRTLGLGYANLGTLLMRMGLPYDSDAGRAVAGAITAVLTGYAYATSAELAAAVGPFPRFGENREAMLRVIRNHRRAAYDTPQGEYEGLSHFVMGINADLAPAPLLNAARQSWDLALNMGERHGYRNAQVTVIAPTGCLVGGSLVPTERGLVRLGNLGDPRGAQWQYLGIAVGTDEGPRTASQFYVNGVEPVVTIETKRGYRIQGTPTHRIKVMAPDDNLIWKRFAEVKEDDLVPLQMNQLIGEPQVVPLPGIGIVTPDVAELAGIAVRYGTTSCEGLRLEAPESAFAAVERFEHLLKILGPQTDLSVLSADVEARRVPDAILGTNDPEIYDAFLKVFTTEGGELPRGLAADIQTLLLALGRVGSLRKTGDGVELILEDAPHVTHGFLYDRVASAELGEEQWTYDISVPSNVTYVANGFVSHNTIGLQMDCDTTGVEPDFALVKFKKLAGGGYFKIVNQSVTPALRNLGYTEEEIGDIIRYIVGTSSLEGSPHINRESLTEKGFTDEDLAKIEQALPAVFELKHAFNPFVLGEAVLQRLGFEADEYATFEFDLLRALGFSSREIREATDWICGEQTIEGAPHLREEHLAVFDTANKNGRNGQRFIHHVGHIKMLAATQPFLSGAASKTINMPNEATVEDIEESYMMSYELGVKCMALYRDGSKASQPLSASSDDGQSEEESEEITRAHEVDKQILWGRIPAGMSPTQAYARGMHPPRFLLPSRRGGYTQEARIGGHKVYLRTGEYDDGTLGELFIDLAKEGATLRGILSCFAIAVSKGLQFGVPLEEFVDTFTFQTFEPRGLVEGHPNIKMANSIVDYVFRALAVEYLHRDDLAQVPPVREGDLPEPAKGLALEAGVQLDLTDAVAEQDVSAVASAVEMLDQRPGEPEPEKASVSTPTAPTAGRKARQAKAIQAATDAGTLAMQSALGEMMGDAPLCDICGHITVRNGACYKCLNCGNSLGCS
jgi:ribonucleoside-diphosphate reductase alpha chain